MKKVNLQKASMLGIYEVKSKDGEKLGSIKDTVINTNNHQINYYVLSYGGFLGLGDKLFVIPPKALTFDSQNQAFILDVNKDYLDSTQGFDPDQWPDFEDHTFWRSGNTLVE